MTWAGHVVYTRKIRKAYKSTVGKPEGKRLLGEPGTQEDNI
jgi:hypothetical protein